jgi:fatty acid synthase
MKASSRRFILLCAESFERETTHAYLDVTPGELSSVRWKESSVRAKHIKDTPQLEQCSVYYSALNFRDIVFANGALTAGALPCKLQLIV